MDVTVLFTIQPVPDRGMGPLGMVATTTIAQGTRILAEAPILICPPIDQYPEAALRQGLSNQLKRLDRETQRAYLQLHNALEGDPILNIAKTNALPLDPDTGASGVFLLASKANHDCIPNTQNSWNGTLRRLTFHAVREIQKGEEITVSFLEEIGDSAVRSEIMQERFGVDCTCKECSLPEDEQKESDSRWEEMMDLENAISDKDAMMVIPLVALGMVRRLLSLLEQRGIKDLWVARAWKDAFVLTSSNGDLARASIFGKRAAASVLVCEGRDHPRWGDIDEMGDDPRVHAGFGATERWRTEMSDIPKGLSEEKFEEWLWNPNLR